MYNARSNIVGIQVPEQPCKMSSSVSDDDVHMPDTIPYREPIIPNKRSIDRTPSVRRVPQSWAPALPRRDSPARPLAAGSRTLGLWP